MKKMNKGGAAMVDKYLRLFKRAGNQRGTVIALAAIMMVVFVSLAAIAIDLHHLFVVRNELQDAADAAALAGAGTFYPNTPPTVPDWGQAATTASAAIQMNKSDAITLNNCQVQTGYWNLSKTPPGLQSENIIPGPMDVPAVMVTVSRSPGNNGGPVRLFLGGILGVNFSSVSAQAIAVTASPGSVKPGALLPVVISKEIADQWKNYNSPTKTFRIGSAYHYPNSEAGQWTSFELNRNNVPTIRDLIANGNPTPLSVGDNIWIEPGTKTTLYSSVPVGTDTLVPVVNAIISDSTHSAVPIYAFIGFHITDSVGKNDKYIEGYFIPNFYAGLGGPVGPNYGAYVPPKLVQ